MVILYKVHGACMCRYRGNRGFILVITLVYLQLVSILSLYGLTNSLLALKISKHVWQRVALLEVAERVLQHAERRVVQPNIPNCLVTPMMVVNLSKQSLDWWHTYGCEGHVSRWRYFYVIESMGNNPCAMIQDGAVFSGVDYYKISLLVVEDKSSRILLQSLVAKVSEINTACAEKVFSVQPGRQRWWEVGGE